MGARRCGGVECRGKAITVLAPAAGRQRRQAAAAAASEGRAPALCRLWPRMEAKGLVLQVGGAGKARWRAAQNGPRRCGLSRGLGRSQMRSSTPDRCQRTLRHALRSSASRLLATPLILLLHGCCDPNWLKDQIGRTLAPHDCPARGGPRVVALSGGSGADCVHLAGPCTRCKQCSHVTR